MRICQRCGQDCWSDEFTQCGRCGVPFPTSSQGMVIAGYVCAFLALLIVPILMALAGIIIGIINLTKERIGHGITQIVLSTFCGMWGVQIGVMVWQRFVLNH